MVLSYLTVQLPLLAVKTGITRLTRTDEGGRYRFSKLEPGAYTLRVSAAGFAPKEKQNINTIAGQNVSSTSLSIRRAQLLIR